MLMTRFSTICCALLLLVGAVWTLGAAAQGPAPVTTAAFDVDRATEAYLSRLTGEEKARSDAYFEGGYWLQLWGFLYGLGTAWLLLRSRVLVRLRDWARRVSKRPWLQTLLFAPGWVVVSTLLWLPLGLYEGYFREHKYGLSNQTLTAWFGDEAMELLIGIVFGAVALAGLYSVFRRAPRTWWVWGTGGALTLMMVMALLAPVFINPLFNDYTRLTDPALAGPILSMARANGVPAHDVWVSDASRQTKRVSANVAGFLGTERITLNDNLLARCGVPEILAVMGHELGHYVLNHVYEMVLQFGLLILAGFAFTAWSVRWALARWGEGWGLEGLADPAALPVLTSLLAIFFFVATPISNTIIRTNEVEADVFGLNAAQEPDGFAEVALKLGEYRKLDPSPLEEWIFFDHPSGRNRIRMAMQWKAEQLAKAAPAAAGGGQP